MSTPSSVLVRGATQDVWPVAAALARALPPETSITVAEEGGSAKDIAVLPLSDPYWGLAGVGIEDLVHAGAEFALGYALEGFDTATSRILAAPSGDLPAVGGLAFHHILRRVVAEAGALDRFVEHYGRFRFCARAAQAGKMALPDDAPQSPLAMLGPLVVIDRTALALLLCQRVAAPNLHVVDDGSSVDADFQIDMRATVSGGRALTVPTSPVEAEYIAGAIPTYRLLPKDGPGSSAAFALDNPWSGNRVLMGPASAHLGGLFAADARLLHLQVLHLAGTLPASGEPLAEARRFNQLHRQSVARLEELVAAPICLGHENAVPMPEGLALRVEQFRSRGRLPEFDGEVVDRQFWIDLLIAFGVVPEGHDRRADAFDARQLDRALGTIRGQLEQALAAMPESTRFRRRFASS